MITVANRRKTAEGEYVGRPSVLGNPFSHQKDTLAEFQVATREDAIACYEEWLRGRLEEKDPFVCGEMNRLYRIAKRRDLTLLCWCAPSPCHADVIRKILEERL